jgi:threonine/homoserine/homoserine lactone efflux protein
MPHVLAAATPMLEFAGAIFGLIITPGPGVLTTAGVGSGYGFQAGVRFIAGLFVGTNLVALAVVSGIAAAVFAVPYLRTALIVATAAYLLYLALKIALAGSRVAFIHSETPLGAVNGILLQLINPKAYAVNTFLFSGFPIWPEDLMTETTIKFAIINAIWIPIHFAWLYAGVTLHRLDLPQRTQRRINAAMAISMLLVVGLAALAQR